jgi:hypothetical protein
MMRCGKFDISSLFSRRLKLWIYGGVSLILADFEMPMAHAAGYLTYSMSPAATLSAIKLMPMVKILFLRTFWLMKI